MASYDRRVLQRLADDLYRRARWITIEYVVVFGALGGIAFALLKLLNALPYSGFVGLGLFLVSILLGAALGSSAGFKLRVQAQQTLWMLEVERKLDTKGNENEKLSPLGRDLRR